MKFSIKTGEALEMLKAAIAQKLGGATVKFVKFCDSKGELVRVNYIEVVTEDTHSSITFTKEDASVEVSTHASTEDVSAKLAEQEQLERDIAKAMRWGSCTRCLEGVLEAYERQGVLEETLIKILKPKFNDKVIKRALYYTTATKMTVMRRYNSMNDPWLILKKFW